MKRNPNLLRFLLASLCAHVAIMAPWPGGFQFPGHRETVLTVTLDATKSPPKAPPPIAGPTAPTSKKIAETVFKKKPNTTPNTSNPQSPLAAWTPDDQTSSEVAYDNLGGTQTEFARARIQAQVLLELQRYFEYPLLARRRGWEGTVHLSFVVQPDGALYGIQVAHSSGHGLLDDSAVASVRRIEYLADARQWLGGRSLKLDIPVIYRLKDR